MAYVEFLEYIGRCASLKYSNSSEPLYVKIERLLDEILPFASCTRKEMIAEVEVSFEESDDDEEKYKYECEESFDHHNNHFQYTAKDLILQQIKSTTKMSDLMKIDSVTKIVL